VNLALFVVVADDRVYHGPVPDKSQALFGGWQQQLREMADSIPWSSGAGGVQ